MRPRELYAQRLARAGAVVTGIDFSRNSLRYAGHKASQEGLAIKYIYADYLEFETDQRFDLIMMIMCDFCALSPSQRSVLLRKIRSDTLATGGSLLFDIYSSRMFDEREETATYARNLAASRDLLRKGNGVFSGCHKAKPSMGLTGGIRRERSYCAVAGAASGFP